MYKRRFFALIGLFLIAQWTYATETPSSQLASALSHYTTYQAHFTQVNYDHKNQASQKSEGRVFMAKPGRFRWETTQPYEQTVIANGDNLWIYDVDLKQATQQSLAKRGFNPAQLLTEPVSDLARKFNITQEDGWFKLVPNQTDKGFQAAYLQFKNNQLTGLKIINQFNQTNVFSFTQIHVNENLSPSLFNFKPPAGVQVLKSNEKNGGP